MSSVDAAGSKTFPGESLPQCMLSYGHLKYHFSLFVSFEFFCLHPCSFLFLFYFFYVFSVFILGFKTVKGRHCFEMC